MMYPLVLDLAADKIPITVTCRVLGFSTQAFYAWKSNPISQRDWDDAHVTNAAIDIHHDDPAFGYRFIVDELSTRGIAAGQNRVARLCSQQRIWSVFAKRRGPSRKAGPPVHDDLVDRQFNAAAPNLLWLTDITEHPTGEGKLYLCAITDVHSNRIVGYSIDSRMKASLAVAALRNAIGLRNPAGTIVHSDRGSSGPTPTSARSRTTACSARWAESVHAGTTPRWSRSSRCCKRTSWTANAGRPEKNCGWRSSPGSNAPTTADAGNDASAGSPRSSLRCSTNRSHSRPEVHTPRVN
jgi:transposase InsO family protein